MGLAFFDVCPPNPDLLKTPNPSNASKTPIFPPSEMDKVELRACLNFGSEGERDEIVDGVGLDFEGRSGATGR